MCAVHVMHPDNLNHCCVVEVQIILHLDELFVCCVLRTIKWIIKFLSAADEQPSSGSDSEKQLLEAAKSGDLEIVKVCGFTVLCLNCLEHWHLIILFNFPYFNNNNSSSNNNYSLKSR